MEGGFKGPFAKIRILGSMLEEGLVPRPSAEQEGRTGESHMGKEASWGWSLP